MANYLRLLMTHTNYSKWAEKCYSRDFKNHLSPLTKQLTSNKCVLCGRQADITHHAFYTMNGARDKPGVNLFPLCKIHHLEAHSPVNWKKKSKNPVTGRLNKPEFLERLRRGWSKYAIKRTPLGIDTPSNSTLSTKPINITNKLKGDQYNALLFSLACFTMLIVIFAK